MQNENHANNQVEEKGVKAGLRKKLTLYFVFITAIPLLITTVITSYFSHSALTQNAYENNRLVATSLANDINQMMDAKIKLLTILSKDPSIISMDTASQLVILKNVAAQYADMTSLIVADRQGMQTVRTEGTLSQITDRDYFKELVQGKPYVISDLVVAKGTGKISVILGVPIHDIQTNGLKGVLLGVVDANQLGQYIAQTKIGETGYAFLVDKKGKIVAHPDAKLVQEMADVSALPPVQAVVTGKTGSEDYEWQGQKRLAGYSAVNRTQWGLIVQQSLDEAMAGSNHIRYVGTAVTVVAIILAGIIGVMVAGRITRPLQEIVAVTAQMAGGDLTVTTKVDTDDEIGAFSASFNRMITDLKGLILQVMNTAEQVAASAEELSATSNEAERAITQISEAANELAQGAQSQTAEIEKTALIVKNLAQSSNTVSQKAMSASQLSGEMELAAQSGSMAAGSAVDKMNEIKSVTAESAAAVSSLGAKSEQIGQIVDVITNIASQTNLLALNAAIEAARAGNQGRGFAVVAEEVRKLAEQSQEAAKQITEIIMEIQEQTEQAMKAMQTGSIKVGEGVEVVEKAGSALDGIRIKVRNSVDMIGEIANAAKQQVGAANDAVKSIEQIAVIADQSSANAEHTAATTQETTASMEEIAGAAQSLAEIAGQLQVAVSKFKL